MPDRQSFDAMKAASLTHALSTGGDATQAAEMLSDWRAFLTDNFSLTDDQRQWLDSASDERDSTVKRLLREVIESGGAQRLVVVMVADNTVAGGLYHELRKESVEESSQGSRANFVIAHCDANCRHWGWGRGRPKRI
jgi:hypothetical protein